jgi:PPOX class probable F420-dependent enzyme
MLDIEQRRFVEKRRTATLATTSETGQPRLVPICFVLADPAPGEPLTVLYSPLDEKPKQGQDVRGLARVRDIAERPEVTLLFDRWSEDWSRLAWLRARGSASLIEPQEEDEVHQITVAALRVKYPQYRRHVIDVLPMIRVVIGEVVSWSASEGLSPS